MASWAEDMERGQRFDELLREEPGFMPDPKPARRVKADLKDWERMRTMLAHDCQVCGGHGYRYEPGGRGDYWIGKSLHHLVPKSQGGDDVLENLAVLCGHGTVGCHGDVEARRNGARERLRLNMTYDQLRYVIDKKGIPYVERHYPLSANEEKEASDAC